MASVDNRIVRMEFDNAAFEKKASATLGTLKQLNEALRFEGASKGLADVNATVEKTNFGPLSTSIDGISAKFLAMSSIAITALSNITNRAIDAGIQLAKSLSLEQIGAGFKDYELKIGATQTIMAGTGESLDVVTKHLKELDVYADKTIYNLGDMINNMSKFTNAGVKLPTATTAMIGIANAAARAGATSEEASRAMYNFGQAIGTGTVRLMDWKSIELANMGTLEFKQQLIDSALAMGTLTKETDGTIKTLEGADVSAQNFAYTLEDEWLTADALIATLERYGDQTTDIGKKSWAAAQDVKSFSMMMETLKAGISTGWTDTFDIIIGNLDESKALFTDLTNTIGGFFGKMSDSRNAMLQVWKDLGGRTELIDGLKQAFKNFGAILKPIGDAFRSVFPKMTGERLFALTKGFHDLMKALEPSKGVINAIKSVFTIFFNVLKIGWTVIKEGVKFIGELIATIAGSGSGKVGAFFQNIASVIADLAKALTSGGAITRFFERLLEICKDVISVIGDLKDKIVGLFKDVDPKAPEAITDGMDRMSDRYKNLKDTFTNFKLPDPFRNFLNTVKDTLDQIWEAIKDFFGNLADKISEAIEDGDWDAVFDALNVALLGGIVGILGKFMKSGIKFDLGTGFFEGITDALGSLTGVLDGMQKNLKAEALLKIAGAIALLTASVLVLSMIDSEALTKALVAMGVGFGQLMASFAILSKISIGPTSALSFGLLAGGMILLAGAILVLSVAAKNLAELSWEEIAKGLTATIGLLAILIAAASPLSAMSGTMIRAGVGLLAISGSLLILGLAMKLFASMNLAELGTGLVAVAAGLTAIGLGMKLMPKGPAMVFQGIGLLAVATALNILAGAMKIFGMLSWGEIGKGMVAMAGGLLIIGLAMKLMPAWMPLIGAGLLLVGMALVEIGGAMKIMASMSWGEIAKGLVAMAGALIILGVAANAMSGALVGAIAIGIMAASLLALALVLKAFAALDWGDLAHGLIAIGIALAALAAAAMLISPAVPSMILLGVALMAIGAGFALLGFGAAQVAKAFEIMARVGKKGSEAFVEALKNMGKAIPAFVTGLAEGMLELIKMIGEFAPEIATTLGKILNALIDELMVLVPKLGELIGVLIQTVMDLLREKIPEYALLGVDILLGLLEGLREAIPRFVTVVGEIITGFLDAFTVQIPRVVTSIQNFIRTVMSQVILGLNPLTLLALVGSDVIKGFLDGITGAASSVLDWFGNFIKSIINTVKGWLGINSPSTVFLGIGTDIIMGLLNGLKSAIGQVSSWFMSLGSKIIGWIGDAASWLVSSGYSVISGFFRGIVDRWNGVKNFFDDIGSKIKSAIGDVGNVLFSIGSSIIQGLWNGMKAVWDKASGWLGGLGAKIAEKKGPPKTDKVILYNNGMLIMQGLHRGMEEEWALIERWLGSLDPADSIDANANKLTDVLSGVAAGLEATTDFNPTITPVLDLTQVARDAGQIGGLMETPGLTAGYSRAQANVIATTAREVPPDETATLGQGGVTFEQNIYAPEQLSTADIYRQTRNQITLAKEELKIL